MRFSPYRDLNSEDDARGDGVHAATSSSPLAPRRHRHVCAEPAPDLGSHGADSAESDNNESDSEAAGASHRSARSYAVDAEAVKEAKDIVAGRALADAIRERRRLQRASREARRKRASDQYELAIRALQAEVSADEPPAPAAADTEAWRHADMWGSIDAAIDAHVAGEQARKREEERVAVEEKRRRDELRRQQEAEQQRRAEEQRQRELAAREQEEARQKEEAQAKQRAEEERRRQERAQAEVVRISEQKAQQEREAARERDLPRKEYEDYVNALRTLKQEMLEPIAQNKELKNKCFAFKRKITPKIGQLTQSVSQIKQVTAALEQVFGEARQISEAAYLWCLNFFCKAVVKQAETEVIVAPKTALPLGAVCVLLMQSSHARLRELLVARIVKNCPWAVPYTANFSLDTEEGRRALGFKRQAADGKWEEHTSYTERMSGIFSVYAAIIQTAPGQNPYGIEHGWTMLARLANRYTPTQMAESNATKDLAQTVCAICAAFCDIAGRALIQRYGEQAHKLLRCVFSPQWIGEHGGGSNFVRLRLLGDRYRQQGMIGIDAELSND